MADIWLGTDDSTRKSASDWKTIAIVAEGQGAGNYLWSKDANCASGDATGSLVGGAYKITTGTPATTTYYPYYCGYHALNLTDTTNPKYLWHIKTENKPLVSPYFGDPWSKMIIGRILLKTGSVLTEKWVGFIGGGYGGDICTGSETDGSCRGKGFFIVDLSDGSILWSYSYKNNTNMKYSLPATPAVIDQDNDGFIDTAYIGDLGGNMWRFNFCRTQDINTTSGCGTTDWSGQKLFDGTSGTGNDRPIFANPTITIDPANNYWVYWGTGNKMNPTSKDHTDYFYGVKDNPSLTYTAADMINISGNAAATVNVTKGFRRILGGSLDPGEKILSPAKIFKGVVYFTSYVPSKGGDSCNTTGTSNLYGIDYLTGGPALTIDNTVILKTEVGPGFISGPATSTKDGKSNLYVSGGKVDSASGSGKSFPLPDILSPAQMIYWRDRRIQ